MFATENLRCQIMKTKDEILQVAIDEWKEDSNVDSPTDKQVQKAWSWSSPIMKS